MMHAPCACAGNVFLWDRLMTATRDVPLPFLEDFVRARPVQAPARQPFRTRDAAGTAAAQGRAGIVAAAAQLASVRSAVAAAVGAILGAEVRIPTMPGTQSTQSCCMHGPLSICLTSIYPTALVQPLRPCMQALWWQAASRLEGRPNQPGTHAGHAQVPPDQPLMEAGLDSLGAVDLRNALSTQLSVELPSTLTFDHPTLPALAAYIAGMLPE